MNDTLLNTMTDSISFENGRTALTLDQLQKSARYQMANGKLPKTRPVEHYQLISELMEEADKVNLNPHVERVIATERQTLRVNHEGEKDLCPLENLLFQRLVARVHLGEVENGKNSAVALAFNENELIDFEAMPIKRHKDGYFIATWMMWEKEVEYQGSWKKRWANEHDQLADFGKLKRKVRINAGEHKSYDMPMNLHHIPKAWFYFDSYNVNEVERLIDKWIFGIGKKTSQGYGEFSSYIIENADFDFQGESCRPVPISEEQFLEIMKAENQSLRVNYTGFRPPYWLPQNQTYCLT